MNNIINILKGGEIVDKIPDTHNTAKICYEEFGSKSGSKIYFIPNDYAFVWKDDSFYNIYLFGTILRNENEDILSQMCMTEFNKIILQHYPNKET